jgi:nucleoside-diphosphate kinase
LAANQRSLSLVKPDVSLDGKKVADIVMRYTYRGLRMANFKVFTMTKEQFELFYGEHRGKPFYERLEAFSLSGPMIAFIWEGNGSIEEVRKINGATNPAKALEGTIREKYGNKLDPEKMHENVVHGSDSPKSAEYEINVIFGDDEE